MKVIIQQLWKMKVLTFNNSKMHCSQQKFTVILPRLLWLFPQFFYMNFKYLLRVSRKINSLWRGSLSCLSWNAVKYFQLMETSFHLATCKEDSTWYGKHYNECISLIFMNWKVCTMVLPIKILMEGKYCTWMDPGIPTQKPQHSRSELSALVSCVG